MGGRGRRGLGGLAGCARLPRCRRLVRHALFSLPAGVTVAVLPLPPQTRPGADLDHHNPQLRQSLTDWLRWLHRDLGFEGWRFDFVRGYAPEYCRE